MDVEVEVRQPQRAHLLRLASSNSLNGARADSTIARMVAIAASVDRIAREYPIRPATRKPIVAAIGQNCAGTG